MFYNYNENTPTLRGISVFFKTYFVNFIVGKVTVPGSFQRLSFSALFLIASALLFLLHQQPDYFYQI